MDALEELFEEDTDALAHIPSITVTPPTPPPSQSPKSKSYARGGPEGNFMEQWLARGRGASMRSQEVVNIRQSQTQPLYSSKGTPEAVASNPPTYTATGEEHLTLHSKPREPEGNLGC